MKFCIPIPCFLPTMSMENAIYKVKELGFDTVETYDWKTINHDAVKRACAETGVTFLSMCTTEFRMTDPTYRKQWLDGLRESCDAARALGVTHLITQVGQDTGAERAYQHESVVAALKDAKPILEDSGVTVMIEPLNTYVNHPGYYLWSSKEAFDMIREVNHPLVKVVYDIYHQQIMEGNIIPSITENLDCIAHLHSAGHPGRHELQFGENDYHVIFDAVDKAGYKGACGLEYMPLEEPEQSLKNFQKLYMR